MNDISSRIEQLIKKLDISNAEFARRIGVTRSSVSLWINGPNVPSETTLREICRQFNVDYNWLKFGESEMFLKTPTSFSKAMQLKFELSDTEALFISTFLESDKQTRNALISFTQNFLHNLQKQG